MSASSGPAEFAAGFARGFSIEATRPSAAEIAAVATHTGPGRQLYLSAVPSQPLLQLVEPAALARRAGLEPVVHLPARRIGTAAELHDLIARLRAEADLRRMLVIAGDVDNAGIYPDALALIRDGGLQRAGIEEIGIAGYPEGHPRIPPGPLATALSDKIAAAAAAGLRLHIVSQFAFSAGPIVDWLRRLRAQGIDLPVKVGMAGPTGLAALIRYAKRCGVNASIRGLASGAAAGLVGNVGPDRIIDGLIAAGPELGDIAPHYFSFGGIAETARYACERAARRPAESHAMSEPK